MDRRPRVIDRSGVLCEEEHPNIWHATFLTRGTRPTWARLPTNVHTPQWRKGLSPRPWIRVTKSLKCREGTHFLGWLVSWLVGGYRLSGFTRESARP